MLVQAPSPKAKIPPAYYRVSWMYNLCAVDLLGGQNSIRLASNRENPKGIPTQAEFSSVLQQYVALVDIQIGRLGQWERVTWIQDFDSGVVEIGLVIGDMQTQSPPYDSLHQQEV